MLTAVYVYRYGSGMETEETTMHIDIFNSDCRSVETQTFTAPTSGPFDAVRLNIVGGRVTFFVEAGKGAALRDALDAALGLPEVEAAK